MDLIEKKNRETYTRLYSARHIRAGYGEIRKTAKILEAAQSLHPLLDGVVVLDVGFGAGHSMLALVARGAHCIGSEPVGLCGRVLLMSLGWTGVDFSSEEVGWGEAIGEYSTCGI